MAKKTSKDKKEKQGPKRAKTAYFFFIEERRPKLVKEKPELKAKEIVVILGEEWRKLKESEKKKYQDLSNKDKERFNKEKAAMEAKVKSKK